MMNLGPDTPYLFTVSHGRSISLLNPAGNKEFYNTMLMLPTSWIKAYMISWNLVQRDFLLEPLLSLRCGDEYLFFFDEICILDLKQLTLLSSNYEIISVKVSKKLKAEKLFHFRAIYMENINALHESQIIGSLLFLGTVQQNTQNL